MFALAVNLALLAPYLDSQTFAVVHVDVAQMDMAALRQSLGKTEPLERLQTVLGKWKDDYAKAGGKDVFIVFSLADEPGTGFVVIPYPDETTAAAIDRVLHGPASEELGQYLGYFLNRRVERVYPKQETVARIGNAYIVGPSPTIERLRKNKPTPRPELKKAFEAAGNSFAQLVLAPTADQRRVIEEMVPTLPEFAGGGPSRILTRGIMWSTLGIEMAPRPTIRVYIQSQDEASAKSFQDWFENLLQVARSHKMVMRYMPQYDQLAALLKLRASGDHLSLTLNDAEQAAPALFRSIGLALDYATGRTYTANKLHQIALALANYESAYGAFPAIGSFDKDGKPLLSWRVLLLPYLENGNLFNQFHLDEPWDSEHNKKLIPLIPQIYRSWKVAGKPAGYTNVVGPVGKNMFFTGDRKGIEIKDITDGTSNTIEVVEADWQHAVPWTKPEDLKIDQANPAQGLAELAPGVFGVAFVDGSVHFLSITIDKETLYHLFTINGGEVIDASKF